MRRRLLLFDIDGTLVRDGGRARDAFADALTTVFDQQPPLDQFDFSGRTDPEIVFMVLAGSGLEECEIEKKLPELWRHYLEGLERRASDGRSELIDGVLPLLREIERSPSLDLALLTGNIEPGARFKLARHDLNRFFTTGAFGSDSPIRSDLPPIALQRAASHFSTDYQPSDVFIIGDSIHDIRCGKPHGAVSVAVATGKTRRETLEAEDPDYIFEDLTHTEKVLEVFL